MEGGGKGGVKKGERIKKYTLVVTKIVRDLGCVPQWIERQPENQRIAGSILSLGHLRGLWATSPIGGTQEAMTY